MRCRDIGPADAKIMLIGEAPGAEEERQGVPFVGGAGRVLKAMLRHCGIDYSQCYVTNVMSERPPGNNFKYYYESSGVPSKTLEEAWIYLRQKIETIRPDVVILLGGEPLRAVTNKTGIMTWRGTFLSYKGITIMPTYHPAAVMREYKLHPIFEMDVMKAVRRKPAPWPSTIIEPNLEEAMHFIIDASESDLLSFDLETIGKDIRCIGLAYRMYEETKAISIPFIRFTQAAPSSIKGTVINVGVPGFANYWSEAEELIIVRALAKLFHDHPFIVGQNSISFDEPLLWRSFKIKPRYHEADLMHMWHILYCEFPKSLNFICSALTDYPNYWSEKDTSVDVDEWTYNARDAIVTVEAVEKVIVELNEAGLADFYFNHIHPLAFELTRLGERGFLIDRERLEKHKVEQEKRAALAEKEIKELAGHDINPASPKQIKTLLFEEMHLPTVHHRGTGQPTTDEEALRKLAKSYPDEMILQKIIDFRKATKLLTTYLNPKLPEDSRMRSSYNPSGTETGRLSSSRNLWGEGQDMQNIPAGKGLDIVNLRDIFVAPKDKLIIVSDLKQAETMVVAEILDRLGFPQLHNLYQDPGFDIHKWAASLTFEKLEGEVTKRERDVCKIKNHSGNYMAGPNVMVATALKYGVDIDYQLAKKLTAAHRKQIPGIETWWEDVEKRLRRTRTLETCHGRRRIFFGRIEQTTIREAVAWEPQSTIGDLTNLIIMNLIGKLPSGCYAIAQVHDEIVFEVWRSKLKECLSIIKEAAQIPINVSPNQPLIVPLELSYGPSWKEQEEVT